MTFGTTSQRSRELNSQRSNVEIQCRDVPESHLSQHRDVPEHNQSNIATLSPKVVT